MADPSSNIAPKRALNGPHPELSLEDARNMPPRPTAKHAPKNIPIEAILHYVDEKGLTNKEAATQLGCSERNIAKRLRAIRYYRETDRTYQSVRPFLLRVQQRRLADALTDKKINKMAGEKNIEGQRKLHEMERLEEGKSTSNIHTYREEVQREKEIEREIEALNVEMGVVGTRGVRLLPTESDNAK